MYIQNKYISIFNQYNFGFGELKNNGCPFNLLSNWSAITFKESYTFEDVHNLSEQYRVKMIGDSCKNINKKYNIHLKFWISWLVHLSLSGGINCYLVRKNGDRTY